MSNSGPSAMPIICVIKLFLETLSGLSSEIQLSRFFRWNRYGILKLLEFFLWDRNLSFSIASSLKRDGNSDFRKFRRQRRRPPIGLFPVQKKVFSGGLNLGLLEKLRSNPNKIPLMPPFRSCHLSKKKAIGKIYKI